MGWTLEVVECCGAGFVQGEAQIWRVVGCSTSKVRGEGEVGVRDGRRGELSGSTLDGSEGQANRQRRVRKKMVTQWRRSRQFCKERFMGSLKRMINSVSQNVFVRMSMMRGVGSWDRRGLDLWMLMLMLVLVLVPRGMRDYEIERWGIWDSMGYKGPRHYCKYCGTWDSMAYVQP